MESQVQTAQSNLTALFVRMAISAWQTQNARLDEMLEKLSDEDLGRETAPGRNTGLYLLGHLTAVNDNLLRLFGFEERIYPDLQKVFISNPDNSGLEKPSAQELRKDWKNVVERLNSHIEKLQPEDWFQRHTAVSEEDFAKEPHRNKLNVLLNRTSHQSYHLGQLAYLMKKSE